MQIAAMEKRRIEGAHTDAVLCCHVMPAGKLLVSGGEDGRLCFTDLATLGSAGSMRQPHGDAVTAVCSSAADEHRLYASAGQAVMALDLRKGLSEEAVCDVWAVNQDEVNHIAVNRQGSWLAVADDSGEVQVINLQQPRDASGRPSYKTLRRGHSNICSAVAFRPHRPWELLSGGLDATVVRWDFNRLRPQQSWNLSAEAAASGGQVFNPPMVHSVAVPDTEDRALSRLMAVGRGDGYISVYDIDSKPALPPGLAGGSGSSGGGGGGGKKGSKAKHKGGGDGKAGAGAGAAAAGSGEAATSSSAGASSSSTAAAEEGPQPGSAAAADPWRVPFVPGRVCLLGREQGGHTAAVNCLTYMHGSSWQRLLSGGNDGRLVLWDWQAAAGRQGAAWRAAAEGEGKRAAAGAPAEQQQQQQQQQAVEGVQTAVPAASSPATAAAAAAAAAAAQAREEEAPVVVADVKHGRKVNWVCSCEPVGGYNVFVADVSRRLTALALR